MICLDKINDLLQKKINDDFKKETELQELLSRVMETVMSELKKKNWSVDKELDHDQLRFSLNDLELAVKQGIHLGFHHLPDTCSSCTGRLNRWVGSHTCIRTSMAEFDDNPIEVVQGNQIGMSTTGMRFVNNNQRIISFPVRFVCTDCYERAHAERIIDKYVPEMRKHIIEEAQGKITKWWEEQPPIEGSLKYTIRRKIVDVADVNGLKHTISSIK